MNKGRQILYIFFSIFWIFSTIYYFIFFKQNFSQLAYFSPITNNKKNIILNRDVEVKIEIFSPEDFLGTLEIPFSIKDQNPNGSLIFKIKEFGAKKWYYVAEFNIQQFVGLPLYPFGFTPIANSSGKKFEISLLLKHSENAMSISMDRFNPSLKLYFQYSKDELFANKELLFLLLQKKIYYSISQIMFVILFPIFGLPFLIHKLTTIFQNKIIFEDYIKKLITLLILISITISSVLIHPLPNLIILSIVIASLYHSSITGIKPSIYIYFSLILLLICAFLSIFNLSEIIVNISIWAYISFLYGLIKQIGLKG